MVAKKAIVPLEYIAQKIYLIRGEKVMLDFDLAEIYEVNTKRLNEQVKRNVQRFPEDFMFQLTIQELNGLRSQIATSKQDGRGGRRTPPYVFTEQGVAMLSSVLNSDRAIDANISIIRTFTKMRYMLASHKDLARKIEQHDKEIANLYAYLEQLLYPAQDTKKSVGFIWKK